MTLVGRTLTAPPVTYPRELSQSPGSSMETYSGTRDHSPTRVTNHIPGLDGEEKGGRFTPGVSRRPDYSFTGCPVPEPCDITGY